MRLAIIGGTGVYDPAILGSVREAVVQTPYGPAGMKIGEYHGQEIAFVARHGFGHTVPPHMINHKANIAALKILGVERVIATSAVGSLNPEMKPGMFVFVDQFIDFAKSQVRTFFDGGEHGVVHLDYTEPYCPEIRAKMEQGARALGIEAINGGCYVCLDGPRFETPAEIRMFAKLGGDLAGMTGVPEAVLAREAQLCYASIAMVTNWAAGISKTTLTHQEVVDIMQANGERLRAVIMAAIDSLPAERGCACADAGVDMPWLAEYKEGGPRWHSSATSS